MAINQQITSAPTAPQRSDPNTFADRADAFVAWLENLDDELNQWASECNSTEKNINDSEQTVLQAKSDTLAARDQAVAEANAKVYDDSETYNYPDCVIGSDGHVYRCMGNNITGEDPVTSTSGNWKRLSVALNSNKQLELPFAQTPILVNGQDMMSRVFYVDAENGDDNNDGSESAPFRTIKKACDSVPIGGYGKIYLKEADYSLSSNLILNNKWIDLIGESNSNVSLNFNEYEPGKIYSIILNKSNLWVNNMRINIPAPTGSIDIRYPDAMAFNLNGSAIMFYSDIYIENDSDLGSFYLTGSIRWSGTKLCYIHFNSSNIYTDSSQVIHIDTGIVAGISHYFSYYYSRDGQTNRNLSDLIVGIVKDANGVPRNIISNIVF